VALTLFSGARDAWIDGSHAAHPVVTRRVLDPEGVEPARARARRQHLPGVEVCEEFHRIGRRHAPGLRKSNHVAQHAGDSDKRQVSEELERGGTGRRPKAGW